MTSQEILVKNLEKYRERYGMNYNELAKKMDIPYTTLTEIVRGKRIPRLDTLDLIAQAMQVEPYELLLMPYDEWRTEQERGAKETFIAHVWKLPRKKRKLLELYLKMLEECGSIQL